MIYAEELCNQIKQNYRIYEVPKEQVNLFHFNYEVTSELLMR